MTQWPSTNFTHRATAVLPIAQLPFHRCCICLCTSRGVAFSPKIYFPDGQRDDVCYQLVQVTRLDFAPEHAHSYNELIEVVKLNLLLADWNDEDHNESLLSARNSKWGKEMLRNVRWLFSIPKRLFVTSNATPTLEI